MISTLHLELAKRRMHKNQLAEKLNVSPNTISRWCKDNGLDNIKLAQIERIAKALDCKVTDLFKE